MIRHMFCGTTPQTFRGLRLVHTSLRYMCLKEVNHYDVLKIKQNASSKEVKAAIFELSKEYHPDSNQNKNNNHEKFLELQRSYDFLSDTNKRSEYDRGFRVQDIPRQGYGMGPLGSQAIPRQCPGCDSRPLRSQFQSQSKQSYSTHTQSEKEEHKDPEENKLVGLTNFQRALIIFHYTVRIGFFIGAILFVWKLQLYLSKKFLARKYKEEIQRLESTDIIEWTPQEKLFYDDYMEKYGS